MFEDKIDILREHIEHLREFLADGWEDDADFEPDELISELESYEEDVQELKDNLPYDEVDEYGEDIEDFSGDNLEEGELEDELVEAEEVIEELEELIQEVRNRLDEETDSDEEVPSDHSRQDLTSGTVIRSKEELCEKLQSWVVEAFKEENTQEGIIESEGVLTRRAIALLIGIGNRLDADYAKEVALPSNQAYGFMPEEISSACNHSHLIFRTALSVIELYAMWHRLNIKDDFVFEPIISRMKRTWTKHYKICEQLQIKKELV